MKSRENKPIRAHAHDRDPFSETSDPYPPPRAEVGRRAIVRLALASPVVATLGCAAPRHLVCAPTLEDAEHCTHRFCKYHAG